MTAADRIIMMGQVNLVSKLLFTLLKVISYTVQMAEIKIKALGLTLNRLFLTIQTPVVNQTPSAEGLPTLGKIHPHTVLKWISL